MSGLDIVFLLREAIYWTVWTACLLFGLFIVGLVLFQAAIIGYCLLINSVTWCRKMLRIDVQTLDEETRP